MSNLSSHSDSNAFETFESVTPAPFDCDVPPLLQALKDRARWFHDHPTQSPLLMRLEADANQRENS